MERSNQYRLCYFSDVVDNFGAKMKDGKHQKATEIAQLFDWSDSDDWDTDLEDEITADSYVKKNHDMTGVSSYKSSCIEYGICQSMHIIKSLQQSVLSLRYKSCGLEEIKAIKTALLCNTTVKVLDLEGNLITEEGVRIVKDVIADNVFITELNLSENKLGSTSSCMLSEILKESKRLTTVNFKGNKLQDKDALKLAEGISANESVRYLNLSHNEFRSLDNTIFPNALKFNDTIYELDLSWNHLRLQGAVALADGIAKNNAIEFLNLAFNGFANDGASAMGRALTLNKTLTVLDLSFNRISNDGAKALSKGIMRNCALRVLKIGFNPITSEGSLALLLAMKHVRTLEELWMENISLNTAAVDLAEAMIKERNGTIVVYGNITKSKTDNGLYSGRDGEKKLRQDILDVIKEYLADKRLRMLDLFNQWDKDKSMRLTKKKFIIGLRNANIPLSTEMVTFLIKKVHENNTEEGMNYAEFVSMLQLET